MARNGSDLWLTPADYARHRRVSRQAVHKAIAEGRIPLVRGRIDRVAADRDWEENSEPPAPAAAGTEPGNAATYNQARTLVQIYRARRERFELEELEGKRVDAQETLQAADDYGRRVKDALMSLPGRLGPRVAAESSRVKCEQLILAEVRRLCEELADAAVKEGGAIARPRTRRTGSQP